MRNLDKQSIAKRNSQAPYRLEATDPYGHRSPVAYGEYEDMVAIKRISDLGANVQLVVNK